jgi:hypothetical protein
MPQHQQLDVLGHLAAAKDHHDAEQPPDDQIHQRERHLVMLSIRAAPGSETAGHGPEPNIRVAQDAWRLSQD